MLLAIGAMVVFNSVKPIHFTNQIIIQGILFFFLLLGFFMAFSTSDKVKEVYVEEKQNRDRVDEMKKATKEVQLKIDQMKNIPTDIVNKLNDLQENLRFLSPCNNSNAYELEAKFVEEMRALNGCFFDIPLNLEKINDNIQNCNRTLKERKQIFSN
jgi:chromosome segregation ATPase